MSTPPVLTPRQAAILTLAAEGLTNGQIGARLYIAESTVHAHLDDAYRRLGVPTGRGARTHAAILADRAGLLGRTDPHGIEAALQRVAALEPCATIRGCRLVDLDQVLATIAGPTTIPAATVRSAA
ncbi:helix-turn-helix transcriptional regulator [Kitasatospora sp. NBC_00240]|uniref:LuxR C-terminal-related transcriptional regulator n=1 Tax=Kitasatospora sp. NBC_00240 TaxID=2903567 RepID=UPI00224D8091|nr:helix-turn-helix transcriptional regulator [Kitasatospora sp. NBC_00240]MCX5209746.1 helix-turn-helix transcriptional regulator [Kitasatospora sp. NBC_00240]